MSKEGGFLKNALSEFKLNLTAKKHDNGTKRPFLSTSVVRNNLQLFCITYVNADRNGGKVRIRLSSPVFFMYMNMLDKIIDSPNNTKYQIENKRPKEQGSNEKVVDSTLVVGKDDRGMIYVGVVADGVTPTRFYFGGDVWHNFLYNGVQMEPHMMSELRCKAYREEIAGLTLQILNSEFYDSSENNGGNSGGGGYSGNRGGGNNNYGNNKSSDSSGGGSPTDIYDEDIGF